MRLCFDLDGTLCTGRPYEEAQPIKESIQALNDLSAAGHEIIIYTARGMSSCKGNIGKVVNKLGALTLSQLEEWGVRYDEIIFGKPCADLYVDDKGVGIEMIPHLEEILERTQ